MRFYHVDKGFLLHQSYHKQFKGKNIKHGKIRWNIYELCIIFIYVWREWFSQLFERLQSLLISLLTGIKLTFTLSTEIMESKSLKKISLQLDRDISYPFNPFFTCNSILRLSAVSLECCKSSLNISLSCLTESYSRLDTPADSPEAPAPSRKLAINLSFDYKNIKSLNITKKILKILTT